MYSSAVVIRGRSKNLIYRNDGMFIECEVNDMSRRMCR